MTSKTPLVKNHYVYGIHTLQALLNKRPQAILCIYYQHLNPRLEAIIQQAQALGLTTQQQPNLDSLLKQSECVHQGLVAHIKPQPILTENELKNQLQQPSQQSNAFYVVLDGITDPQNFGSIIRTAEAAKVDGLIILNHHAAPINATAHKTSSGAIEFIPIFRVANLARGIRLLQQHGIWTIAMTLAEDDDTQQGDYFQQDLRPAVALVLGSEASGIRPLNLKQCDQIASLPMLGVSQSLNVANAASIAIYEVLRQRLSSKLPT